MPTLPRNYKTTEALTDDLCLFIQTPLVQQITGGIHVNDALIHDAWGALPPEWAAYWDSLPNHRLAQREMIDAIAEDDDDVPQNLLATSAPESLRQWLTTLKSVSLPRIRRRLATPLDLPDELTLPMKTKKISEVSVAAAYILKVCQSQNITHIIDMGSGQGYLSVTLAHLHPTLRVLAIDGSASQLAGSQALATALHIPSTRLTHLERHIDGSPALAEEMRSWVTATATASSGEKCMLVGLHACGRLSEHMLRYFATCPFITQLAAVGCCYNHLVPRSEACPEGFPISARLSGVRLSATALMTGCQAPGNWESKEPGPGASSSSVYSRKQLYRAMLEKLFWDCGVEVSGRANWGIRKGDLASFAKFAQRAMHCLGVDEAKMIPEGDIGRYEERYGCYEGRIAILWTLSVLCCKAVESVIALDRYWFLVEQGAKNVDIVPIFEYKISPRNLMMVAEKG